MEGCVLFADGEVKKRTGVVLVGGDFKVHGAISIGFSSARDSSGISALTQLHVVTNIRQGRR